MNILFLNNSPKNCGVHQYGIRSFDILKKDTEINYIYKEIKTENDYKNILNEYPTIYAVIYNYHVHTMNWLNVSNIQHKVKNIGIIHESSDFLFDIIISPDPDALETTTRFSIPRPIYENISEILSTPTQNNVIDKFITEYTDTDIPIFGSFGFGFDNKGFDKIVKIINNQYDNAIIKFVIPIAHYDPEPNRVYRLNELCMSIPRKSGIIIMISHEFFSTIDLLKFLHSNTMNIFLYDYMYGRGISSTIDYALSVRKPISISDSYMFRHIYSDQICLYKTPIIECLKTSSDYFLQKYSHSKFIEKFKNILYNIYGN
jgi:hypothetical protein